MPLHRQARRTAELSAADRAVREISVDQDIPEGVLIGAPTGEALSLDEAKRRLSEHFR